MCAVVAQATSFGPNFRFFALLVLPVVLLVGLATILRLDAANGEDFWLLMGMNRLRHGYLELAPELEPYFVTEYHDDARSVIASYGMGAQMSLTRVLAGTPNLVAAINILVFGIFAALVAQTLGVSDQVALVVGLLAAFMAAVGLAALAFQSIRHGMSMHRPRFPCK